MVSDLITEHQHLFGVLWHHPRLIEKDVISIDYEFGRGRKWHFAKEFMKMMTTWVDQGWLHENSMWNTRGNRTKRWAFAIQDYLLFPIRKMLCNQLKSWSETPISCKELNSVLCGTESKSFLINVLTCLFTFRKWCQSLVSSRRPSWVYYPGWKPCWQLERRLFNRM